MLHSQLTWLSGDTLTANGVWNGTTVPAMQLSSGAAEFTVDTSALWSDPVENVPRPVWLVLWLASPADDQAVVVRAYAEGDHGTDTIGQRVVSLTSGGPLLPVMIPLAGDVRAGARLRVTLQGPPGSALLVHKLTLYEQLDLGYVHTDLEWGNGRWVLPMDTPLKLWLDGRYLEITAVDFRTDSGASWTPVSALGVTGSGEFPCTVSCAIPRTITSFTADLRLIGRPYGFEDALWRDTLVAPAMLVQPNTRCALEVLYHADLADTTHACIDSLPAAGTPLYLTDTSWFCLTNLDFGQVSNVRAVIDARSFGADDGAVFVHLDSLNAAPVCSLQVTQRSSRAMVDFTVESGGVHTLYFSVVTRQADLVGIMLMAFRAREEVTLAGPGGKRATPHHRLIGDIRSMSGILAIPVRSIAAGYLNARVLSLDGRVVETLYEGVLGGGTGMVFWHTRRNGRHAVPAGAYVVECTMGAASEARTVRVE